jgi:hypothetical protein
VFERRALLFSCFVDAELLRKFLVEDLCAAADSAQATVGNDVHERSDPPSGAYPQVVRQVVGEHSLVGVLASTIRCSIAFSRRCHFWRPGSSSIENPRMLMPVMRRPDWPGPLRRRVRRSIDRSRAAYADEDDGHGEFVADVFELVADSFARAAQVEKVQIVDFSDRGGGDYAVDLR